jgi:pimeloyl-ACP methyl ester carboxylesterase
VSIDENLKAGISAAKSGDNKNAASILAQVVKDDPLSVDAWYWLGKSLTIRERREYCFRRALLLDPMHAGARRELGLDQPLSSSAPVTFVVGKLEEPTPPEKPAEIPALLRESPTKESEVVEKKQGTPAPINTRPPPTRSKAQPGKRRRGSNTTLVILSCSLAAILICILVVGFLIYSGQLSSSLVPVFQLTQITQQNIPQATVTTPELADTLTVTPTPYLPTPKPTVTYDPTFDNADCPFDIPPGANVACGYVIVPEDRSGDPSRTIRLLVAVYKAEDPNPDSIPVVFLQGGPGAGAVELSAKAYENLVAPFIQDRDFIVFDQRGTGLSYPSLDCEELTKAYLDDIHGLIPGSTRSLVYSNAFISCNGVMIVEGVELDAYTTSASAADVRDILLLLGHPKANLYGASYGTRLAQIIMRDFPDLVNSAVLDSVVPVEANLFTEFQTGIESALDRLFEACSQDPGCKTAYPQLETVFWELVDQLDAKPITLTTSSPQTGTITETLNGSAFMNTVLGSMKQSSLITTAPQTIYRFKNGDYSALIDTQASLPNIFEGISPGLYITMICHEQILAAPLEDLQIADKTASALREYAWLPFYGNAQNLIRTCQNWGAQGPWSGENEPLITSIPTLLIAGAFDPTTPPSFAQQLHSHLNGSYYIEFPNQGHTPTASDTTGCAMEVAVSFLAAPHQDLEEECLTDPKPNRFITPYTGTPPYLLKTIKQSGISLQVPQAWEAFDQGIYLRNNSPLDIAQVGIAIVGVRSDRVVEFFVSPSSGFLGLDSPPVEIGRMQANDLEWILYSSSSDGRPVDIGVAGFQSRSIILNLISNKDEHEALYQTVFLPMLRSTEP